MPEIAALLRRGIRLPPSGYALAAILAFYVLAGLFGRDPWKGEDAIHIGTAWHMLHFGDWLSPDLAGRPFNEPPLYYWTAALTGKLFGWLLPLHEAMRIASGIWVALALTGLYYAGRELYGEDNAAASPLLLAGCAGLLLHAHDAQPMLVAVAAFAGGLGAMATLTRQPRLGGIFYGISLAACFLGTGIAPTIALLSLAPLTLWLSNDRPGTIRGLLIAAAVALALSLPWPLLLLNIEPARFHAWLATELAPFKTPFSLSGLGRFTSFLPLFAFPALPIAGWTLWLRRHKWRELPQILPLAFFVVTLILLAWTFRPREIPALLLLPPIALLATPGALNLRKGAANAFDWFAMTTFSFFVLLVWICWSAMALGWPAHLAKRIVILRPGFIGEFNLIALGVGLLATAWWIWLIVTAPRSNYRSLTHWTLGCTTLWLLATTLILPWFNYGQSYRPVAEAVAKALPADNTCLAERGLNDTQRASLAYFVDLKPSQIDTPEGKACDWLLVVGSNRHEITPPGNAWTQVWQGNRPGNRKEKFRLYRR